MGSFGRVPDCLGSRVARGLGGWFSKRIKGKSKILARAAGTLEHTQRAGPEDVHTAPFQTVWIQRLGTEALPSHLTPLAVVQIELRGFAAVTFHFAEN